LVNEVAFFIAPSIMGTDTRALHRIGAEIALEEISYRQIGPDLLCHGLVASARRKFDKNT
jgi:hypothetical protein